MSPEPIPEDRPLSSDEAALIRWLLTHGNTDAADYLPHIDRAWVISRCYCACASIDFAIDGVRPPPGEGINILSDFEWRGADRALFGVFVFARCGLLAGLEVWSQDGLAAAKMLPRVDELRSLGTCSIRTTRVHPEAEASG